MVIETTDFDISAIAESGQCFRITKAPDSDKKTYDVIYRDKYVRVSEEGYDEGTGLYKISFDCEKNEYENVWRHYFDMDTDYAHIVRMADKNDSFLNNHAILSNHIYWQNLESQSVSHNKKQICHPQFLTYPLTMDNPYGKLKNRNNLFQACQANILLESNDRVFYKFLQTHRYIGFPYQTSTHPYQK